MKVSITDVRQAHPVFFAHGTAALFDDVSYRILHDKQHNPYLVRNTYGWSDMFGGERVLHWRINPIGKDLTILPLDDHVFGTLAEVKIYLKRAT